jgi:hypothetical protein
MLVTFFVIVLLCTVMYFVQEIYTKYYYLTQFRELMSSTAEDIVVIKDRGKYWVFENIHTLNSIRKYFIKTDNYDDILTMEAVLGVSLTDLIIDAIYAEPELIVMFKNAMDKTKRKTREDYLQAYEANKAELNERIRKLKFWRRVFIRALTAVGAIASHVDKRTALWNERLVVWHPVGAVVLSFAFLFFGFLDRDFLRDNFVKPLDSFTLRRVKDMPAGV